MAIDKEALLGAIEAETRACRELIERLAQEHQALGDGRVADLEKVVADKHALLTNLDAHSTARLRLMDQLPTALSDPRIATALQQLKRLAEQARDANQALGLLIDRRRQQTARLLAGLLRKPGGVYGPDGRL